MFHMFVLRPARVAWVTAEAYLRRGVGVRVSRGGPWRCLALGGAGHLLLLLRLDLRVTFLL